MTAEKGRKLKKSFVDEMQSRILSGQLKPGDRLPPERELAEGKMIDGKAAFAELRRRHG